VLVRGDHCCLEALRIEKTPLQDRGGRREEDERPCQFGDDEQVIAAARRILPPDLEPAISNRCLLRDNASAEIVTEKVLDHPGVKHWWVTNCHRDSRDWACYPGVLEQEVEERLMIDGLERHVEITIDSGTALALARSLVIRALGIYDDPVWILPYCGGIKGEESRWQLVRKQHPLPSGEDRIHVTVRAPPVIESLPPTIGSVLFDDVIQPEDFKFEIQLKTPNVDKHDPWYPCWMAMAP
jgi:hypothetical protein